MSETLRIGSPAFYDTFAGLIPARVVSIQGESGPCSVSQTVILTLTATRGAYRKGETIETNGLHAVPRNAVHTRNYKYSIQFYTVEISQ